MHIKKHVEWNGKKFSGYEDFGIETSADDGTTEKEKIEPKQATNAMVVGVNQS